MDAIQPPVFDDEAGNHAPAAVCGRWMNGAPCGAAGSHHVIWDSDMSNGCVCSAHAREIRQHWVFMGLHPYTADCAGTNAGTAVWIAAEDRCITEPPEVEGARSAAVAEAR